MITVVMEGSEEVGNEWEGEVAVEVAVGVVVAVVAEGSEEAGTDVEGEMTVVNSSLKLVKRMVLMLRVR